MAPSMSKPISTAGTGFDVALTLKANLPDVRPKGCVHVSDMSVQKYGIWLSAARESPSFLIIWPFHARTFLCKGSARS